MEAQTDSLRAGRERFFRDSVMWADSVRLVDDQYVPQFNLDTVVILPELFFWKASDWYRYNVLRRKVLKVYPLARIMGEDLEELDRRLARMTPAQQRRYKRIIERYVRDVFVPQLKNLTVTEGRVLTRLVYRQTGMSVYDFLKKYKSGLSARWWQSMAKIYKIDLKSGYDPAHSRDDFWMEDILQRAFADGLLEKAPSKVPVDYFALYDKWMDRMPRRLRRPVRAMPKKNFLQYLQEVKQARRRLHDSTTTGRLNTLNP